MNNEGSMLIDIVKIINYIGDLHKEFSKEFFSNHDSFNLKRTTVAKVIKDESTYDVDFINLVDSYIEEITMFQLTHDFEINNDKIDPRFTGKTRESALNKLYYYSVRSVGADFPLQKCLNDLLGFRIIIDNTLDYNDLLENIKKSPCLKTKISRSYIRRDIDKNRGIKYIGIHIYFKSENNRFFPWELQIWQKADAILNEKSHRKHKQKRKYINWAEEYKDNRHEEE